MPSFIKKKNWTDGKGHSMWSKEVIKKLLKKMGLC